MALLLVPFAVVAEGQQEAPAAESGVSRAEVLQGAIDEHFSSLSANGNYMIGQADFVDKVRAGDDMLILDIRQADAYAAGHIKGAVNVPWGPAIAKSIDFIPTDKPVMVYCYTGQTANQANALLNFIGADAKSVKFGWNLGISKVEGIDDVVTTEAAQFPGKSGIDVNPVLREVFVDYFENLADVSGTMYSSNIISEENVKKIVDAEDDTVYILSIRQESAYNEGHVPGAELISWGDGMQQQFSSLPADKKIIVYCYTGQTAGQTVGGLRVLGYDAVSMKGGMGTPANAPQGWSNQGYPVVSE
ncbi:MAG: sulfurtransferase [Spirochaetaceae bacterium]|nr:sulfurtransferase [Spirochaetaceae bacterium]